MFGVAFLRYRSALGLEQFQVSLTPPGKVSPSGGEGSADKDKSIPPLTRHLRILNCVIKLKERGASGGFNGTVRRTPFLSRGLRVGHSRAIVLRAYQHSWAQRCSELIRPAVLQTRLRKAPSG